MNKHLDSHTSDHFEAQILIAVNVAFLLLYLCNNKSQNVEPHLKLFI